MNKSYIPTFKYSDYIAPQSVITSCYQIVDGMLSLINFSFKFRVIERRVNHSL